MGRKSRAKAARRAQQRQVSTTSAQRWDAAGEPPVAPGESWPSLRTDKWPVVAPQALPQDAAVDPGCRLRSLSAQQKGLLDEIEREIGVLLEHGHNWSTVGAALGISRQGARQRYRHLIDRPAGAGVSAQAPATVGKTFGKR